MDILIPHSWLKDYLKTTATAQKIAECLSLCGPSVECVTKIGKEVVYSIEVTTNRPDTASVYGIAREAVAILPRFGIKSMLQPIKVSAKQGLVKSVPWLDVSVDHKLCSRFAAILIKKVKVEPSPKRVTERLKLCGLRPINNVVDLSNYLCLEFGMPMHTFDYDKISGKEMVLRSAKAGEELQTLDKKTHKLQETDIVIYDGKGRLIDLVGIMGGENTEINQDTKNVLLLIPVPNPVNIRKTSMSLSQRTDAAALFEKGLDPEQVEITIRRAIDLFIETCGGKPENKILDLYPIPYKPNNLEVNLKFINKRLGIELRSGDIKKMLESLEFKVLLQGETLQIQIPSWRARDINIPEDIVEEVARIYGYHNFPSELMSGKIPDPPAYAPFAFEIKVKNILKGRGGIETYTCSMTSLEKADLIEKPSWILRLKNPLGKDGEYMRLSLAPSLVEVVKQNTHDTNPLHLFEIANIYPPVRGELPEEKMMLSGMFARVDYRVAKGIIEALFEELGIENQWKTENFTGFVKNTSALIKSDKETLGRFGKLESGELFYEFDMQILQFKSQSIKPYKPVPKYPPQIEDITIELPNKILIGEVIKKIKFADRQITNVSLTDIYNSSYTFQIYYQNPDKTLLDNEVTAIRKKIIDTVGKNFQGRMK